MWVLINCVFQKNQPILSRLTNVWTLNCSYYSFILLLISIGSAPLSFLILVIFVFFFVLVCLARGPSILLIFPKNHLLTLLISCFQFYWFLFKKFIFRGEGRQKERERKSTCEWNIDWLPLARPQLETWPTTQACTLTGNWISDLSLCRTTPSPLSHTSQGQFYWFLL